MDHIFTSLGSISAADQIPGTYLAKLLDTLREADIDTASMLRQAGFEEVPELVFRDEVPIQKYLYLAALAMQNHRVPAVAFRAGSKFNILDQGLIGYAMISSPTLRDALHILERYGELLGSSKIIFEYLDVDDDNDEASYTIECALDAPLLRQFELEQHSAQFLNSLPQFISRSDFRFKYVNYSFPEPDYSDVIRESLDCPTYWGQPLTEIVFHRQWLNQPLTSANQLIHGFCLEHCQNLLSQLVGEHHVTEQLKRRILRNPTHVPSMTDLASHYSISERSLRRRFSEEGTSYQEVVFKAKMTQAEHYLRQTDMSAKEIGLRLGYTEVPNFQRAFRRWSGTTPLSFRKRSRAALPSVGDAQ